MDAPTKFFFGLGSPTRQKSSMVGLHIPDGTVTSDPAIMREEVSTFYSALYRAEDWSETAIAELLEDLPLVSPADKKTLDSTIMLQELTMALNNLASGKSPGLDGLPAEFKHFWNFF